MSRTEFVPLRTLSYHVRLWGEPAPGKVPLVMVHGWMDVSASWQFVVDALQDDHYVIAPDWRGYGLTGIDGPPVDNYWFPDYLADLDFLLDHYSPAAPVDLVGHSMAATRPSQAPKRYAVWMDELKALHRGELALKSYDSAAGVARRLMKTNARLDHDRADWLAQHWARQGSDGQWRILGDAAHKITNASLYRVDEVLEIYQQITAPTLSVEASDNSMETWWKGKFTLEEFHERLKSVPSIAQAKVTDAGHMLHHDQPEQVARLIGDFVKNS
jgi:pimeloyl-ACP methyl ester carboxylesterase